MAQKPKYQIPENITFVPVTESFKVAGGARRQPPTGTLEESGALELNAEASDGLDRVADLDSAGRQYSVHYQASEEHMMVEIRIAIDGTIKGQMAIHRSSDGARIALHLGNVFEQHPKLRPDGRRKCTVVVQEEHKRLVLLLQAPRNTRTKAKTNTEKGAQESGHRQGIS